MEHAGAEADARHSVRNVDELRRNMRQTGVDEHVDKISDEESATLANKYLEAATFQASTEKTRRAVTARTNTESAG